MSRPDDPYWFVGLLHFFVHTVSRGDSIKMSNLASPLSEFSPDAVIDSRVFVDRSHFEKELTHLFGHAWLCLGHGCETLTIGTSFRSEIGGEPLIIGRGQNEELWAFIDECPITRESLVISRMAEGEYRLCSSNNAVQYDLNGKCKTEPGVRLQAVSVETFNGFIFGSLDPIDSLENDLGPLVEWWKPLFSLGIDWKDWELITNFNYPTDANWKAFMQPGDGYHVQELHKIFSKSMLPANAFYTDQIALASPTHGHTMFSYPPPDYDRFRKTVWPGVFGPADVSIKPLIKVPDHLGGYIGINFPNCIYAIRNGWDFFLQLIMPRSPDRVFVYNKIYSLRGLTEEQKRIVQKDEDIWAGPMGLNGQDDASNFDWQQRALRGDTLRDLLVARYDTEEPGAASMGTAPDSEVGYRGFFRRVNKYLSAP